MRAKGSGKAIALMQGNRIGNPYSVVRIFVVPAKAGIQSSHRGSGEKAWLPTTFVGMTGFLE